MKTRYKWLIGFLIFSILILIGYIVIDSGIIQVEKYNDLPSIDFGFNPTPTSDIEPMLTAIADITLTPGVEGAGVVATEIPWGYNTNLGDQERFGKALRDKSASAGFDIRAVSVESRLGHQVYCDAAYWGAKNPNIPLNDQVVDAGYLPPLTFDYGEIRLAKGSLVCESQTLAINIYAGVPQIDLQNFTLEDIIYSTDDLEERVTTQTSTASVVLRGVRFGILDTGIQPGSIRVETVESPNWTVIGNIYELGASIDDRAGFEQMQEIARTHAANLALLDAIAPIDWYEMTRSNDVLMDVFYTTQFYFNNSSGDPGNPWPYDNLFSQIEQIAIAAGYEGLETLTVELVWPFEEGVAYYVTTLNNEDPIKVIADDWYVPYLDNLYPWISDINHPYNQ